MSMGFRSGRYKNKLMALLLFLSIIMQQFVCPALIRATELDDGFYATYWDLFNSIASEMGYSMSEIKEDHNVSRPDVMDRANVNFLKFMDWLGQSPSINHSGGGHDIEDDSSGDHSGGGTSIREDTEVYIEEAKNLIQNATSKGLKMSQGLWDAFKTYFEEVDNETVVNVPASNCSSLSQVDFYCKSMFGITVSDKFNYTVHESLSNAFVNQPVCILTAYPSMGYFSYSCGSNSDPVRMLVGRPLNIDSSITDYPNSWYFRKNSSGCYQLYYKNLYAFPVLCFHSDGKVHFFNCSGFMVSSGENFYVSLDATAYYIPSTVQKEYSPFIIYTPIEPAPLQVPDIIPWSIFPDHEVTDDDTKIYIPVESPDEESPSETPEEPTETPEEPTETPGDSDDGDDITNLVPIFPDIDIDPDIHLPDDWINPPDIDLDPDVDVDTPSPGGKIPHLQKLKEKFPFCIPFDLVLLFKMLNKKPKAPKWEFKHDFQIGDSKPYTWEVVVDMADYDKYVQIFREGFFLLFLVGLFFVTKKLISWQTG